MGKFKETGKIQHAFEKFLPQIRQTFYKSEYVELGPDSVQGCRCFVSQLMTKKCIFKGSAASPVAESIAELSMIFSGRRTRLLPFLISLLLLPNLFTTVIDLFATS